MQAATANTDELVKSLTQAAEAIAKTAAAVAGSAKVPGDSFLSPSSIWWFFVVFGLGSSLVAVIYSVRARMEPGSIVKAIGGGGIGSAALAALGTQVSGLSVHITVTEAIMLAVEWFIIGSVFWIVAGVIVFYVVVMRPLSRRFGRAHGARAFIELLNGVSSLKGWMGELLEATQADRVWDEFACAFEDVSAKLAQAGPDVRRNWRVMAMLGRPSSGNTAVAIDQLRKVVGPHICELCAQLTRTTLNFTVWRVSEKENQLEHLVSFPVEPGHEAGYGLKSPLPIWKSKTRTGSLAASAMLDRRYRWFKDGYLRRAWPRRKLGCLYDAVGAMPIPCDDDNEAPWAVICVESRDGTLPIESHAMREMLGRLASTIAHAKPLIAVQTIDGDPVIPPKHGGLLSAASPNPTTPPPKPKAPVEAVATEPRAAVTGTAELAATAVLEDTSQEVPSANGTPNKDKTNSEVPS